MFFICMCIPGRKNPVSKFLQPINVLFKERALAQDKMKNMCFQHHHWYNAIFQLWDSVLVTINLAKFSICSCKMVLGQNDCNVVKVFVLKRLENITCCWQKWR